MTAYTTASLIAAYLGVTLTTAQQTQAGLAAQAASDWIDTYKGRSWQGASPVTGEVHTVIGDAVYLDNRPVAAITSVETRAAVIGASYTTLAAGQYELIDADAGLLQLVGWGDYLARVAYTHTGTTPPSHIAFAATIIAASLLGPTLRPNTTGLDSVAVGQSDVQVKFSVDYGSVPDEALTLLGGRAVVIA
jgi:hypothetical protein